MKQESNESTSLPPPDYNSKAYSPIVLIRPAFRGTNHSAENNSQQIAEKAKQVTCARRFLFLVQLSIR